MTSSSNRLVSSLLSLVATAGLVTMAAPARASAFDTESAHRTLVHVGDLDLSGAGDRATLEKRLAAAVRRVCDTRQPGVDRFDRDCTTHALAQARRDAGLDPAIGNG